MMLIGITGPIGSGKDTVADYLTQKGFKHFSLSDEIRHYLEEQGIEETRDSLRIHGNQLRIEHGHDILAKRALKRLERPAVITSIRNQHEVKTLKKEKGFTLILVEADRELRYQRISKRSDKGERKGDNMTFEEFIEKENKELITGGEHEQNLNLCFQEADHVVYNNGRVDELHIQIEEILTKIEK